MGIVRSVGECIYCGANEGLTREHIIPLSLDGHDELGEASCTACMIVTSAIEYHLARGSWWPHRRRLGMATRRPSEQPKSFTGVYSPDDEPENVDILPEHFTSLILPDFGRPSMVFGERGAPYKGAPGILAVAIKAGPVSVVRRNGRGIHRTDSRIKLDVKLNIDTFVRFLAKVALAKAIATYGIEPFEELYLREIVLGSLDEVNSYIGRASSLLLGDLPGLEYFRAQVFTLRDRVHVYIQCFAEPGVETPIYEVVVGKLRRDDV